MHMVGHDDVDIDMYMGKMHWYGPPTFINNITEGRQMRCGIDNTAKDA